MIMVMVVMVVMVVKVSIRGVSTDNIHQTSTTVQLYSAGPESSLQSITLREWKGLKDLRIYGMNYAFVSFLF